MFKAVKIFRKPLAAGSAASSLAWLLTACANPGPPQPPSLHLPAQVSALKAERVAGQVLLSWTTPHETTDGLPLQGTVTAVACRELLGLTRSHTAGAVPCTEVARAVVTPGESRLGDALPATLLAEPPVLLGYRVELFNARGRSARPSAEVYAASGAAPDTPKALRVSATRQGARVEWQPGPPSSNSTMELTRRLAGQPALAPGTEVQATRTHGEAALPTSRRQRSAKDPSALLLLRASATGGDVGGTIDTGVVALNAYTYTAQRVRTVSLQGHSLELRSEVSPPVSFTDRDVFPPGVPTGLESVAASGSIDLSWDTNVEADLLGYNVYRALADAGPWVRLNREVVGAPAYRDLTVIAGQAYRYRVTSVDRNQNESSSSLPVREILKLQAH